MSITFKKLHIASTVARHSSIAKAAKELAVSPSGVAAAIDSLEEELGVRLFDRQRARGAIITAAGRDIIDHAQKILASVDSFKEQAAAWVHSPVGELHVGCFASISSIVMPPLINTFSERHPNVHVTVHEGTAPEIERQVREGNVDIILTYDFGFRQDVRRESLISAPTCVAISENSPMANQDSFRLEELAEMPMILYDQPISRDYFMNLFRQRNLQPKIHFRTRSSQTMYQLVASGLGYSLLNIRPRSAVSYLGSGLVHRKLENNVFVPSIILAYPNRENRSHGVEAFANICKQYFREHGSEFTLSDDVSETPWIQFSFST